MRPVARGTLSEPGEVEEFARSGPLTRQTLSVRDWTSARRTAPTERVARSQEKTGVTALQTRTAVIASPAGKHGGRRPPIGGATLPRGRTATVLLALRRGCCGAGMAQPCRHLTGGGEKRSEELFDELVPGPP